MKQPTPSLQCIERPKPAADLQPPVPFPKLQEGIIEMAPETQARAAMTAWNQAGAAYLDVYGKWKSLAGFIDAPDNCE